MVFWVNFTKYRFIGIASFLTKIGFKNPERITIKMKIEKLNSRIGSNFNNWSPVFTIITDIYQHGALPQGCRSKEKDLVSPGDILPSKRLTNPELFTSILNDVGISLLLDRALVIDLTEIL